MGGTDDEKEPGKGSGVMEAQKKDRPVSGTAG